MNTSDIGYMQGQQNWGLRILKHSLFWLFHVFYNVATWGVHNAHVLQSIHTEFCYLVPKILMTYFTLYFLIPKLLLPKKYRQFVIFFLIGLILTGLLSRCITYYLVYPLYYIEVVGTGFWKIKIFFEITSIVNITALAAAIKLLEYWYTNEHSRKQIAQEKLAAELQLLKSQVHPHFLFNTLNNLYALTLEQSPLAPDMVLKLSSLLNYMLYECNSPLVPLEKELQYIEDYVSLEKLRYGSRLALSFEVSGVIEGKHIAPLILLPFIENSFKHGASQEAKNPWIHFNLWVKDNLLHLQVENSIDEWKDIVPEAQASYTKGIGLKNVKRRLDLIYKDRYDLKIRQEDSFLIILKLQLD